MKKGNKVRYVGSQQHHKDEGVITLTKGKHWVGNIGWYVGFKSNGYDMNVPSSEVRVVSPWKRFLYSFREYKLPKKGDKVKLNKEAVAEIKRNGMYLPRHSSIITISKVDGSFCEGSYPDGNKCSGSIEMLRFLTRWERFIEWLNNPFVWWE